MCHGDFSISELCPETSLRAHFLTCCKLSRIEASRRKHSHHITLICGLLFLLVGTGLTRQVTKIVCARETAKGQSLRCPQSSRTSTSRSTRILHYVHEVLPFARNTTSRSITHTLRTRLVERLVKASMSRVIHSEHKR